jgi:hypothetical protein
MVGIYEIERSKSKQNSHGFTCDAHHLDDMEGKKWQSLREFIYTDPNLHCPDQEGSETLVGRKCLPFYTSVGVGLFYFFGLVFSYPLAAFLVL